MTTATTYDPLSSLIDSISMELFTKEQWEDARGTDYFLGTYDFNDMLSQVMGLAFERSPNTFNGVQWINDDYGFPLWVRPGVEWSADDDDEEDFYS
jgi:long-subunit fatty acid transport protein